MQIQMDEFLSFKLEGGAAAGRQGRQGARGPCRPAATDRSLPEGATPPLAGQAAAVQVLSARGWCCCAGAGAAEVSVWGCWNSKMPAADSAEDAAQHGGDDESGAEAGAGAAAVAAAAGGDSAAGADGAGNGSGEGSAEAVSEPPPPPLPGPRPGAAIWHCWGKGLWWPAYVLDASEVPQNMRKGRVDEEGTQLLTTTEVPLYYYGTHNYFWEKRSRLTGKNKRWRPAEFPPPPRGDREQDPDLEKALQAHELRISHSELLQRDFEYEEERAEQLAAEQGPEVAEEIWIAPKDPKKPKRPGSAYTTFCGEMSKRPEFQGGGFGQHVSEISSLWKALPEKKKDKYRGQIERNWDRYRKQMAKYKPLPLQRIVNPTEKQKKKLHKQIRKAPTKQKRQELLQEAAASTDAANSSGEAAVVAPPEGSTPADPTTNPAAKKRRKKADAAVKRARSAYNFFAGECVFAEYLAPLLPAHARSY